MGEEMKFGAGVLFLDGKPFMDIQEVPEFIESTDSEEESDATFSFLNSEVTATFSLSRPARRKILKTLAGFGGCKGPARYSQIFKHDKMSRKRRQIFQKVVRGINYMIADTGTGIVNDYPVNVTGLPCTDIYEWAWLIVDPAAYSEYRGRKIQRTARSKRRSQRR